MVKVNAGRRASWMSSDASEKLFYKGYQFPICARCTDVIISSFLAFLFFIKKKLSKKLCIIMSGIMFFDWFIQYINIKESTNKRRFVTGLIGGFGYSTLHLYLYKFIIEKISSIIKRR